MMVLNHLKELTLNKVYYYQRYTYHLYQLQTNLYIHLLQYPKLTYEYLQI